MINVKNCPCHHPGLKSEVEMDIVMHLAVWASQDWNKVDTIHPSSCAEEPNDSVTSIPYFRCDTTLVHQQALVLSFLHH
jgi:hypothetical protein